MTNTGDPPGDEEFELTLFGPGYGESIVMHVGAGEWVIVDSCLDSDGAPEARFGTWRVSVRVGCIDSASVVL